MMTGYARVSTDEQSLDPQRDGLNDAGCESVFVDKVPGATITPTASGVDPRDMEQKYRVCATVARVAHLIPKHFQS